MAGTYNYRIASRDVDRTHRVRLYAMGDYILQAAGDDADLLGFGVGDINLSGASWVLSRLAIELTRLPAEHENIAIYTWVSDYGRLMTTRNMVITDESGAQIGAAVSQWAMIDLSTRRALDLSAIANKNSYLVYREPPIERPRKIGMVECSVEQPYRVVYSDIDFNGHVNSMKYIEWMADAMPAEVLARTGPLRLDINYLHEAKLGEKLTVCRADEDEKTHLFDIRNTSGASICKAHYFCLS